MKYLLIYSIILMSVISCKKQGCMDSDALNFDQSAEKDNGTCEYQGTALLWWNESTKDHLAVGEPYNSVLSFYLDEELFYTISTHMFWNSVPNCSDSTSLTCSFYLGGEKESSGLIEVTVGAPGTYQSDLSTSWIINFSANQCISYELDY